MMLGAPLQINEVIRSGGLATWVKVVNVHCLKDMTVNDWSEYRL